MIFSSWQFILIFLPVTFFVYFWFNHNRQIIIGKLWLVTASLFFYGYWEVKHLPLIICSIFFNFVIGSILARARIKTVGDPQRTYYQIDNKVLLALAIGANLLLLGYYKYTFFS